MPIGECINGWGPKRTPCNRVITQTGCGTIRKRRGMDKIEGIDVGGHEGIKRRGTKW